MIHTNNLIKVADDIWCIDEYHPFCRGITPNDFDKAIMNIKDYEADDWKVRNQKKAENFFLNKLEDIIDTDYQSDIVVCYIPPSKANAKSHIGNIASRLCNRLGLIDGTDCLVRTHTINQAHISGDRSAGRQKNSLAIKNKHLLKNASVLLLDDVITSGNSMRDVMDMLINAGASEIIGLGMGITTH